MTLEEAITKLQTIPRGDNEECHILAEVVLLDYLDSNGASLLSDAYVNLRDEMGFWYA
jgi:hypothetical protein